MSRLMVFALLLSIGSLAVPSAFEAYRDKFLAAPPEAVDAAPAVQTVSVAPPASTPSLSQGQSLQLNADMAGHFRTDARMNGMRVEVLVDTGATLIALDETTARRMGIVPAPADWSIAVQTANGLAHAARAKIRSVEIGPIRVRDVDALILKDGSLATTLLGMSFLNALDRFSVADGRLTLVQ
ncbi:aspartyl protease family protein [Fulvimarina manganoxydans]|uniref:Aspartyl protease family protein n=1 Tax=Fulvimarina manganoxydans TaxID=937218 RepID=A0A1W1Z9J0_9HYPH|nr:TIGR02281 family clan AA aspartic protease [Fulvimarina manganoxydans]SMC45103.1 aspartyl protease family protein [Fulvimarina manganoxydans]